MPSYVYVTVVYKCFLFPQQIKVDFESRIENHKNAQNFDNVIRS